MFYVDKNTIPRHWFVGTGYIIENTGEMPSEVRGSSLTYVADEHTADSLAYEKAVIAAEKKINSYKKWANSKLIAIAAFLHIGHAKSNREYYKKQLALAISERDNIKVTKETIPNQIPIKGHRLAIGQKLYKVWPSLEIKEVVVVEERINYYSDPLGSAYYGLSDKSSVSADHFINEHKMTNAPVFTTRTQAEAYVINNATTEIERLQKILEKTRG